MQCRYACGSAEHLVARRQFLGRLAAGTGVLALGSGAPSLMQPAVAKELAAGQKRILVVNFHGGVSQLETWDPKPGTDTGGPFRAIPTSVPGVHISELLPHTAQQMHRLALVRSLNTKTNDHGKGAYAMTRGRHQEPVADYPHLGAVAAKVLAPEDSPLPGHIQIRPGGTGSSGKDSAYLGPKYSSVLLGDGQPPRYSERPEGMAADSDGRRHDLRQQLSDRFALRRKTAATDAYMYSYDQALQLMERRDVFDVSRESERDQQRYGTHDFGRHCLLARRLLEHGIPFVEVKHSNYDTHFENFDFHIEQLAEFDRPFATLIGDLASSGLLEQTLVIVLSEFGRTPKINRYYGRDHWGTAWSIAVAGCGVQPGAVIGKTNTNGTEVADREVDHGHLFHTYLRAVGVDSTMTFDIAGKELPIADPARSPIEELLA